MNTQVELSKTISTEETGFSNFYLEGKTKISISDLSSSSKSIEQSPKFVGFPITAQQRTQVSETQVGWWYGHIEKVFDHYFTAVLEDLKGNRSLAEFDKEEVTPKEQKLIHPNVKLSFSVTRVDKNSGREYVSKISISGPDVWTKSDSEKAKKIFEEYFPDDIFSF